MTSKIHTFSKLRAEAGKKPAGEAGDNLKTPSGFASALCYLAFEAGAGGWPKTQRHLEKAFDVFVNEAVDRKVEQFRFPDGKALKFVNLTNGGANKTES